VNSAVCVHCGAALELRRVATDAFTGEPVLRLVSADDGRLVCLLNRGKAHLAR
jgi:hypothetical protein